METRLLEIDTSRRQMPGIAIYLGSGTGAGAVVPGARAFDRRSRSASPTA